MKIKYIFVSIATIMCLNINAQFIFSLKNLKVSKINIPILKDHYREGDTDGPFIQMFFVLRNNTDSIIKLHPSKSEMEIEFKYKRKTYYQNLIPVIFMEKEILSISPHQQYESFVGVDLFLGTSILKEKNNDYRIELLEVLPTIKLIYKEKGIKVISSEILDVEVIDGKE
jgi:hypothetical protein